MPTLQNQFEYREKVITCLSGPFGFLPFSY